MARILIIDDDADFCALLQAICEHAGHEIVVASQGREGIARYDPTAIDLVIVDILMPEQDGLETILELRQLNPQVKIIAISGGGQRGRRDFLYIAASLGAQRTLRKPFRPQELLEAVHALTQDDSA